MQTKLITLLLLFGAFTIQAQIKTPQPSPSSSVHQTIGLSEVSVDYSRPAMRGRVIFGDLLPFGKVWRTGANMRTKFTTDSDLKIEGKELKKGSYAILSVPNKDAWELIFYTEYQAGGAPATIDESKVALKVSVKTNPMDYPVENFTIGFGDLADGVSGNMYIMWDKTMVMAKIETHTDKMAVESIEKTMAGPSANDYFSAASYYRSSGKDLNKALEWVTKAVEMNPDAFWMSRQKSLIQADLGDKKSAIATAKVSLAASEKAGNADYVKMNQESIAEWSK
jgi:tetratricopeptide (TPR) repeat protein